MVTIFFVLFAFQVIYFRRSLIRAVVLLLCVNAYGAATAKNWIPEGLQLFEPSVLLFVMINILLGVIPLAVAKLFDGEKYKVDLTGITVWTRQKQSVSID